MKFKFQLSYAKVLKEPLSPLSNEKYSTTKKVGLLVLCKSSITERLSEWYLRSYLLRSTFGEKNYWKLQAYTLQRGAEIKTIHQV
jgi:hypothetical protein